MACELCVYARQCAVVGELRCHRNPPTSTAGGQGVWPMVRYGDECGEFRQRPRGLAHGHFVPADADRAH